MDSYTQTEFQIEVKQGSTLIIPIYYKDLSSGAVISLAGYTAKLQVRKTPESSEAPDIELTTESGGIEIDGALGKITLKFLSADTLGLDPKYIGTWDLFIIPTNSTAFCILGGDFIVYPSTTRLA